MPRKKEVEIILDTETTGLDYTRERIIEFATCASVLKHSIQGDINLVDEDTVNSLIDNGLKNIKR